MTLNEKIAIYKQLVLIANSDKSDFQNHVKALDVRNQILATPPEDSMIEIFNGAKYVTISQIEYLLDILFTPFGWSHEVVSTQVIANEFVLTSCLTCTCPLTGQTIKRAGVAADMIRMQKDAIITDISKKIKNALKMDAPHAKSDALKNAAISLGEIFGRNLNRVNGVENGRKMQRETRVAKLPEQKKQIAQVSEKEIKDCLTLCGGESIPDFLKQEFVLQNARGSVTKQLVNEILSYAKQ